MGLSVILFSIFITSFNILCCAAEVHQMHQRHASALKHEKSQSQFRTHGINMTKHELATKSRIGVFILSTIKAGGAFFRVNAMGAHDTWARSFPYLFYVMGDSPSSRFAFRNCKLKWIDADDEDLNSTNHANSSPNAEGIHFDPPDPFLKRFLTARCRNEPAVLLTSACDDSYYGAEGPCCKLDAVVTFALSKSVWCVDGVRPPLSYIQSPPNSHPLVHLYVFFIVQNSLLFSTISVTITN
jgi:hypothetical protein